jgi:hypothetical protein
VHPGEGNSFFKLQIRKTQEPHARPQITFSCPLLNDASQACKIETTYVSYF